MSQPDDPTRCAERIHVHKIHSSTEDEAHKHRMLSFAVYFSSPPTKLNTTPAQRQAQPVCTDSHKTYVMHLPDLSRADNASVAAFRAF
ncbi:hypothetical protein BaRGS_00023749 [Batillaria attramentaria]|uniref:Uncharacterized protein n=1 Tax=Batillaria attramentaria TaxID=370345 RepID=A0ABD0KDA5_9CAEN